MQQSSLNWILVGISVIVAGFANMYYLHLQELKSYPVLDSTESLLSKTSVIHRIAFWSCNHQERYNPFWKLLLKIRPNGVIWMGDNIYADVQGSQKKAFGNILRSLFFRPKTTILALLKKTKSINQPATQEQLKKCYDILSQNKNYQKFKNLSEIQYVTGTWDDHDYGTNDGDKTHMYKYESRDLFLDFFEVSKTDMRRSQSGVYSEKFVEIVSKLNEIWKISIINLDTRFNKDSKFDGENGDFLGQTQWEWLEKALCSKKADIHIIVSSIQVLASKKILESWAEFPKKKEKLFSLIRKCKPSNPFFLSGDIHYAEINTMDIFHTSDNATQHIWDFTSSGMTHSIHTLPYGWAFIVDLYLRNIAPPRTVKRKLNGNPEIYTGQNIGIIDFVEDDDSNLLLDFKIINSNAQIVLRQILQANHNCNSSSVCTLENVAHKYLESIL